MKREELTEKILDIKREKGWTWKYICEEIGGMSPSHPFIRLCQAAENAAYRDADLVVSMLPNVALQIIKGLPIKRGIMNRLQIQVTNTSSRVILEYSTCSPPALPPAVAPASRRPRPRRPRRRPKSPR